MPRRSSPIVVAIALVALLAASFGSASPVRAAAVLHVPADYPTIQAAIAAAAPGDTVLVADGTYNELVTISSAITVKSVNGPGSTTIDGNGVLPGGSPAVAISTGVLHGFTVTRGEGTGVDASGDALVEGNTITNNAGCDNGSGVALSGAAVIKDNLISGNHHGNCDGAPGIKILGSSTATIVGNTIEDTANGYAIEMNGAGTPTIDRNVIRNNAGGGIEMYNDSRPLITNNLIEGNGRLCCYNGGTGIDWSVPSGSAGPTMFNNTIVLTDPADAPVVQGTGFQSSTTFVDNIVFGTSSTALLSCDPSYDPTSPIVRFNDVDNTGGPAVAGSCAGAIGVDGNRSVAPNFADAAIGNYHLSPASILIDAGTNTGAPATDFDGDARPFDGDENGTAVVDIGFDESTDPLLVNPLHLTYAATPVGIASAAKVVTLKNYGSAPLTISSVAVHGANNLNFSVTAETCTPGPLAVGATCTIQVVFTPNAIGARVASLDITGPAPVATRSVALAGTGLDPITVTPAAANFASFVVGAQAPPVSVTVKNSGAATATVTSVSVTGATPVDFPVTNQTCIGTALTTGVSCSMQIGFKPTNVGARSADLNIGGTGLNGTRHVALTGTGTAPPSGVTWNTLTYATPAYSWNYGGSLARTVQSGAQRLHLAYNTDRVGGKWATDTGPYVGAYYVRSGSGATWTTPFRLNSSTTHAVTVGMAASGTHVDAIWTTATKWVNYSNTAPRILYVRVNTNHGASTSWKTAVRLSSTTGRASFPTIAAAGNDVYIAWTNGSTGAIELSASHDAGSTWKTVAVGTTTQSFADGYSADPSVAVSGSTVAVSWVKDGPGGVATRISTDRGTTWSAISTLGTTVGTASVAVRGNRIAVAWTTDDDVVVRQRVAGIWGAAMVIAHLPTGAASYPYSPTVILQDPNRIGVAWAESLTATTAQLRWAESSTGGTLWYLAQTIAGPVSSRQNNDWPSVLWPTASTRQVVWSGWTQNTTSYREYIRIGTGAPTGPTTLALPWTGSMSAAGAGPDRGATSDRSRLGRRNVPPR